MKICQIGQFVKTKPKQTQSNPISKAKLQPCKFQLIKHTWCHKSTVMFTKNNVNRNCFLVKSLHPVRKCRQIQNVDFLQHRVLTHIRVAFRKVETKLKGYVYGWPGWLFFGVSDEVKQKAGFVAFRYEFCFIHKQ